MLLQNPLTRADLDAPVAARAERAAAPATHHLTKTHTVPAVPSRKVGFRKPLVSMRGAGQRGEEASGSELPVGVEVMHKVSE